MQFGSSPRVRRFGYVLLVSVFGTLTSSAQFEQFGQALSGQTTQQQSCDPNDPTCQSSADQSNLQIRNPSVNQQQQQQTLTPQIIVPGQQDTQTNTQNNTRTQQQNQNLQTPLPLDSPTEFQLLVANSIGKMLPIYGVNLFRNLPSTFAPVNLVPVTPDYVVGPGDELLIQMWGQVTLNGRFRVDRSGSIFVPQVGSIHVAGVSFEQMHDFLKSQVSRVFRNFDLNVNLGQLRSIQVFVVGQARRPGSYTISSLSTLTNALFATGGPTPQGSLRHIQLKRGDKVVVDFDLYDLLQRGDKSKDEKLLPGDVIYIPPVGPQVAVTGSVNHPAIYELKSPSDTTVGDVLELAAGLTNVASGQRVRLERVDERRRRSMLEISLDAQGRATVMQDGDLLELNAVVSEYKDAVTLRGNVANPGRYTWKPGMRVRDLLPDKDALITRDYWLKRSQLGQPTLTYIPTCLPLTPYGIPNLRYGIPVGEEGTNPNWRYSSTRNPNLIGLAFGSEEGSSYRTTDGDAGNDNDTDPPTDGGLDCVKIPASQTSLSGSNDRYSPSAAANAANGINGTNSANNNQNAYSGGNPNTPGFPQNGSQFNAATSNRVSAASASLGSTVANASSGEFRPRNNVKLSEPDIDWSYAVIERQSKANLTTSLVPFNLGKAVLEEDASQNLELLPGDVVTIFSKADIRVPQAQQTRFVRLEGEFASSGVYSVLPGETLRQLVERAGGFTSEAYLYGSEFTRESTRRVQQQRLNQYVDEIALQVSTNATNNAGRAISASDTAAAAATQAQNQNIIASLRQARATGRIVLDLKPDSHDLSQIPDLPLEDGDRFIVPRVPSTVSVDGAVYNQNSFVFETQRRLGGYIRLAGGTNRDADRSRAYVIRASGSVISKQYSSSLRGNNFDSLHLYPGDTVVVPLNLTKGNTIRLIVDIAQIVGQFGIAIAAANVVF
ncbi:SLBB domain-containing protein [Tunturibacter empetritectus]|uniref:Protein involved in polysaccharide export with SLBB domain n=1 Tax=Tunturiibacter lichenicola TaxID=2051959 RepID=A0A7W8J632_9BACT|nr:SLBB domain-containing protein [Edaphobacter lichenicola]MBB5342216.1 protein involved in polysaccharide export with SLBB domain [Edaphobacter lichenicola]